MGQGSSRQKKPTLQTTPFQQPFPPHTNAKHNLTAFFHASPTLTLYFCDIFGKKCNNKIYNVQDLNDHLSINQSQLQDISITTLTLYYWITHVNRFIHNYNLSLLLNKDLYYQLSLVLSSKQSFSHPQQQIAAQLSTKHNSTLLFTRYFDNIPSSNFLLNKYSTLFEKIVPISIGLSSTGFGGSGSGYGGGGGGGIGISDNCSQSTTLTISCTPQFSSMTPQQPINNQTNLSLARQSPQPRLQLLPKVSKFPSVQSPAHSQSGDYRPYSFSFLSIEQQHQKFQLEQSQQQQIQEQEHIQLERKQSLRHQRQLSQDYHHQHDQDDLGHYPMYLAQSVLSLSDSSDIDEDDDDGGDHRQFQGTFRTSHSTSRHQIKKMKFQPTSLYHQSSDNSSQNTSSKLSPLPLVTTLSLHEQDDDEGEDVLGSPFNSRHRCSRLPSPSRTSFLANFPSLTIHEEHILPTSPRTSTTFDHTLSTSSAVPIRTTVELFRPISTLEQALEHLMTDLTPLLIPLPPHSPLQHYLDQHYNNIIRNTPSYNPSASIPTPAISHHTATTYHPGKHPQIEHSTAIQSSQYDRKSRPDDESDRDSPIEVVHNDIYSQHNSKPPIQLSPIQARPFSANLSSTTCPNPHQKQPPNHTIISIADQNHINSSNPPPFHKSLQPHIPTSSIDLTANLVAYPSDTQTPQLSYCENYTSTQDSTQDLSCRPKTGNPQTPTNNQGNKPFFPEDISGRSTGDFHHIIFPSLHSSLAQQKGYSQSNRGANHNDQYTNINNNNNNHSHHVTKPHHLFEDTSNFEGSQYQHQTPLHRIGHHKHASLQQLHQHHGLFDATAVTKNQSCRHFDTNQFFHTVLITKPNEQSKRLERLYHQFDASYHHNDNDDDDSTGPPTTILTYLSTTAEEPSDYENIPNYNHLQNNISQDTFDDYGDIPIESHPNCRSVCDLALTTDSIPNSTTTTSTLSSLHAPPDHDFSALPTRPGLPLQLSVMIEEDLNDNDNSDDLGDNRTSGDGFDDLFNSIFGSLSNSSDKDISTYNPMIDTTSTDDNSQIQHDRQLRPTFTTSVPVIDFDLMLDGIPTLPESPHPTNDRLPIRLTRNVVLTDSNNDTPFDSDLVPGLDRAPSTHNISYFEDDILMRRRGMISVEYQEKLNRLKYILDRIQQIYIITPQHPDYLDLILGINPSYQQSVGMNFHFIPNLDKNPLKESFLNANLYITAYDLLDQTSIETYLLFLKECLSALKQKSLLYDPNHKKIVKTALQENGKMVTSIMALNDIRPMSPIRCSSEHFRTEATSQQAEEEYEKPITLLVYIVNSNSDFISNEHPHFQELFAKCDDLLNALKTKYFVFVQFVHLPNNNPNQQVLDIFEAHNNALLSTTLPSVPQFFQ